MTTSCLFLKPQVTTAADQVNQRDDIENVIKHAIQQAGLSALDGQINGLEVSDISDDLIEKVYKADVLIIDANCYETSGAFLVLPYYMAIGHSRGNATILVTRSSAHLPANLITYHTLTYLSARPWPFIDKLKAVVEEIQQRRNEDKPDNPIQKYLKLEELTKARQQIAALQAGNGQQKQGRQPIIFRLVEPDEAW